ncbi:uncharacterized protein LOC125767803 [Anopheles funestus]|uniref:uncharacterized protein LOC125767803 n=1 Tax=Anopheles funestus TaxID=62324 RepID=UPI0020C68DB0|nr:uncharacterized protein LOC125767803 [Anopheles funestus]
MSSARCLNWSRPPPGRHPAALRKQLSCIEPPSPARRPLPGGGRSQSVTTSTPLPVRPDTDFCHFLVTGAIIHTNRLQTYHTYNQAHRGASASLVRSRPTPHGGEDGADGADVGQQQRRRPSSASAGGLLTTTTDERTTVRAGRRAILCKQLSLDRNILVASSIASGMATVASGAGGTIPLAVGADRDEMGGDGWAFNRKQQQQRSASGQRNEPDSNAKKGLKSNKDSRINIKIFLGQTVQQDSSDTGMSDTEGATPTTVTALQQGNNTSRPIASYSKQEPSITNMSSDTATAGGKSKPTNGTTSNGTPNASQAGAGTSNAITSVSNGSSSSGRTSSLAQRRAQFQANRQNSEAHDRRHPPLVRAMSAPIRPADTEATKLLQGKKKPRRRKVLREKDEYNICEEDEFSDDGCSKVGPPGMGGLQHGSGSNGRQVPACILPMRSRSVLGGPCDIETLVSLLSSGGSDSEKEQDATQTSPGNTGQQSPTATAAPPVTYHRTQFSSAHLAKGRAPMLKKAGKSVSFQESDLKPVATAGLNRDYRKPTFQPTVASRIRRTQQLVSTLNAFQLNKDKERSEDKDTDDKQSDPSDDAGSDHLNDNSSFTETATIPSTNVGSVKGNANKTSNSGTVNVSTNGDLQTPKEQECYRLFLKMSKKGLAVSYDTILRGMLTPTELRVLQKKKNRQSIENGTETGTGGESSPENGTFENGTTFEEFQYQQKGENLQLTIPEEPPTVPNEHNSSEQEHPIVAESAY